MRSIFAIISILIGCTSGAFAQNQLSFYGGAIAAQGSRVSGSDPGGLGKFSFQADWDSRPFEIPPYYGIRYTRWPTPKFGWGVEFVHTKIYADEQTLARAGASRLEFTDGYNFLTVNAFRRWPDTGWPVTPYVGAGIGVSVPHVEFETPGGRTFEFQVTGPALKWVAGASYSISDHWSVFGEYSGIYSANTADLENGGELKTDIFSNAVNVGVSFGF